MQIVTKTWIFCNAESWLADSQVHVKSNGEIDKRAGRVADSLLVGMKTALFPLNPVYFCPRALSHLLACGFFFSM